MTKESKIFLSEVGPSRESQRDQFLVSQFEDDIFGFASETMEIWKTCQDPSYFKVAFGLNVTLNLPQG